MPYEYRSNTGAAVITVPAGATLSTAMAFASAANATVQIGLGDLVPVPSGGSVSMDIGRELQGPINVTFTNTDGYLVDWFTSISRLSNL